MKKSTPSFALQMGPPVNAPVSRAIFAAAMPSIGFFVISSGVATGPLSAPFVLGAAAASAGSVVSVADWVSALLLAQEA